MTLCDVDLTDLMWSCAVYVMRRIGYNGTIHDFLKLEHHKYHYPINIGDVVLWDNCDNSYSTPAMRVENNLPISDYLKLDKHYAVYEGNDIISDIQLLGDMQLPGIRFRKLSDLHTKPAYIIEF